MTFFEQSPRKVLFRYECDTIPIYKNQEGCLSYYAERKSLRDIETAILFPVDSTVQGIETTHMYPATPTSPIRATVWRRSHDSKLLSEMPLVDACAQET